jgi:eukaryotic-like serine/threonine-protein kinase
MEATTQAQSHRTVKFGVFEVDFRTAELRKHGVRIRLEEQPFHILSSLLECPGELVTREELRQRLWSVDTFVDFDRSLNKAMSKLRLALGDSSESPRFIETLHRRGYRFIAPVQSDELSKPVVTPTPAPAPGPISDPNLQSPWVQTVTNTTLPAEPNSSNWLSWQNVVAAIVVLCVLTAIIFFRSGTETTSASPVIPRHSVAVLGFKNLSGRADQAWISTALSDWLTTELSAGEQLRTIPEETVARSRIELSLPDVDSLGKESLGRVGKNLNTDFVVVGSYAVLDQTAGGQVRLDLRLQDTRDGETIGAVSESGTEAHLFDLVSQAGEQLRSRLGVQAVTRREAAEIAVALPSNHDAARFYSEGLAKLRVFDALASRDSLQKAIEIEPDYAPSHAALASAWAALGYDENAKSEARRAFELSSDLPRADRLLIEGRYYEMSKNWEKAIEIYRALVAFFPDSLDYGLALSNVQVRAGKGEEAIETVEALQKLPAPLKDDPRIDLAEARAAESQGDYKRDEASCERAAEKARAAGASLLYAEARTRQTWALNQLGRSDEAVRAATEVKQIYAAAHDPRGVANATNSIGISLEYRGDAAGAKLMYEQALATFQQTGSKLSVANEFDDLGDVLLALGDLKGARERYEQSMSTDEEIENLDGIALAKGALGVVLLATGDHENAKKTDQESVDLCRRIGDREKAAIGLAGLGNTVRLEGDLVQARQYESEAISIFEQTGDKPSSNRFQLDLAQLAIDQGNAAEAEVIAGRVAEEFARENTLRYESLASAVLARAQLAQGKIAAAQSAIERSLALASKYRDRDVELFVGVTKARIDAAKNPASRADSVSRLQQVLAEAGRGGFVVRAFEARLALAELEMQSGNRAAALTHLETLQKDAASRGLNLIAQQVAATIKRTS